MPERSPSGARASDALTESAASGKQRLRQLASTPRIRALIATVARLAPAGGRLVEVGYDRGAILFGALRERPDLAGIGIEIQPASASTPIPADLIGRVELLTGDGLAPFTSVPSAIALLAGMGGRTIAEIITRDPERARRLDAIIASPSHLEADIRLALAAIGYGIADEALVAERGRFYEIIVGRPLGLCPSTPADRDPALSSWGPRLFDRRDPLLPAFLEDARRRFRAAFAEDLRSYRSGPKARLGEKLASLEAALGRASSAPT